MTKLKTKWCQNFEKLRHFNNSNKILNKCKKSWNLKRWIGKQRKKYSKNLLSNFQVEKLKEIGFDFDPINPEWLRNFNFISIFKKKFGHVNVPYNYSDNPKLPLWVMRQKSLYRRNKLSTEKIRLFNSLGFKWNNIEQSYPKSNDLWHEMIEELKSFKKHFGHIHVPLKYSKNPQLGIWLEHQRLLYLFKNKELNEKKISELKNIGFEWENTEFFTSTIDQSWIENLKILSDFKNELGHVNVPYDYKNELRKWVYNQRYLYRKGELSSEKIQLLDDLGFKWVLIDDLSIVTSLWQKMYGMLREYKQEFGHTNVPQKYSDNPELGRWVSMQRVYYKRGKLLPKRIQKLESLGFNWIIEKKNRGGLLWDKKWDQKFKELCEFKENYGNTNVPQRYSENQKLAIWVSNQRVLHKKNKLPPGKTRLLESIGFEWDAREDQWKHRFEELGKFKRIHGHTNVPQKYSDNPELGIWVSMQRVYYKRGKLLPKRIQKLESLGFNWIIEKKNRGGLLWDKKWDQKFKELCEFKENYGNTNVPQRYSENQKLAIWVNNQRVLHKKNKLPPGKTRLLESIGFEWDAFEDQWKHRFEELGEFKKIHGHTNIPAKYSDNPELGRWVFTQRVRYKRGKLLPKRIQKLESLGFNWVINKKYT